MNWNPFFWIFRGFIEAVWLFVLLGGFAVLIAWYTKRGGVGKRK
jgi:hypothetical protein